VKKNHAIKASYNAFCAKWIPDISVRLAKKMGSYPEWVPSVEGTLSLWRACIHHTVVLGNSKTYYRLFTTDEAVILSYAFDLLHYALLGPKYPISTSISCAFFDGLLKNQQEGKNGLYFAHEETVVPIVDALGLYNEKLTEDYSLEQIQARKWNLGEIAPYSTNIGFLFFSESATSDKKFVVVMHKGTPVSIPGQDLFCPLEEFVRIVPKLTVT